MPQYTSRDGALRFYDGTGTPFFVEMIFENGDISHPLGRQDTEEQLRYNRGRADQFMHHVEGPDRHDPLPLGFSFRLATNDPAYQKFRDILNLELNATWTVGGNTWASTKGTTQVLSGGPSPALVTTPAFADPRKRTVNVEYLLTDPTSGGSAHLGFKLAEVLFQPDQQQLNEAEDGVTIRCSGQVFGAITEISAFTAGTES